MKGPPSEFFSELCYYFFDFFLFPKGPPSSFSIFCSKLKFQKAQRVFLFTFLGSMRLLKTSHFCFFFENFLIYYRQLKFKKAQRVSPFKFFGTIRLAQNSYSSNFRFFPNFFNATYIFKNPKGPLF